MAFDTYAALQAEVRSFLWDRTDVVEKIPTFITLAESEARRLLRTREASDSIPFSVSGSTMSIPCEAGQITAVQIDESDIGGSRDLDYVSPEALSAYQPFDKTGSPKFYSIVNDRLVFHPAPTGPLSGTLTYVGKFCSLSSSTYSNWLLNKHPDIYLCGALKWAKAWLIDSDQDWGGQFYAAINAANRDNPRVQSNTKIRADEATMMGSRGGFDIRTGGF